MGLSICLAVKVSLVLGLPSRLINPPGNLPAALCFSRYSTLSGKKSISSALGGAVTAATRTTVSPYWTTTAPSACLAILPVSIDKVLTPICLSTLHTSNIYYLYYSYLVPCGCSPLTRYTSHLTILLSQTEPGYDFLLASDVFFAHLFEQSRPGPDHFEQATPGCVVFAMS